MTAIDRVKINSKQNRNSTYDDYTSEIDNIKVKNVTLLENILLGVHACARYINYDAIIIVVIIYTVLILI